MDIELPESVKRNPLTDGWPTTSKYRSVTCESLDIVVAHRAAVIAVRGIQRGCADAIHRMTRRSR